MSPLRASYRALHPTGRFPRNALPERYESKGTTTLGGTEELLSVASGDVVVLDVLRELSVPHAVVDRTSGVVQWNDGEFALTRAVERAMSEPDHPLSSMVRRGGADAQPRLLRLPGGESVVALTLRGRTIIAARQSNARSAHHSGTADDARLTPRERQVADCLGDGMTAKEIACRLGISLHTVRRHTESVFGKLGVNRRGAVMRAIGRSSMEGTAERDSGAASK